MILVDTSVMIDHLRGDEAAITVLDDAMTTGSTLAASVLSRVEVLRGMRSHERVTTWGLLDAFEWIDVSVTIADAAGTFARAYRDSHASIDPVHFVIAATAASERAALWTTNVRHFPMFDRLTPPY